MNLITTTCIEFCTTVTEPGDNAMISKYSVAGCIRTYCGVAIMASTENLDTVSGEITAVTLGLTRKHPISKEGEFTAVIGMVESTRRNAA